MREHIKYSNSPSCMKCRLYASCYYGNHEINTLPESADEYELVKLFQNMFSTICLEPSWSRDGSQSKLYFHLTMSPVIPSANPLSPHPEAFDLALLSCLAAPFPASFYQHTPPPPSCPSHHNLASRTLSLSHLTLGCSFDVLAFTPIHPNRS